MARFREWLRAHAAELLTGASFVVGWLSVTWGVASLLVWQVWPISVGLLLFSLGGWKLAQKMATDGLYLLTRKGSR